MILLRFHIHGVFHLIGILIKRIYSVQWICDIGDLYADNPHTPTAHSFCVQIPLSLNLMY